MHDGKLNFNYNRIIMKKFLSVLLSGALILSIAGCSSLNQAQKGGLIGAGGGAALGAALGYIISGGDAQAIAIGATAGTAVGGTAGALIGNKMDKKAEELAKLENAKVQELEINGLKAIRVTFDSGILFPVNGTTLSDESKEVLKSFAVTMHDFVDTDITVWGHTDNTGTEAVNKRISQKRADAVSEYLASQGIAKARMVSEGKSYDLPIASNDTVEGRAENRRVEIYVTANEAMIAAAEAGTLK